jgi:hypothetical protein
LKILVKLLGGNHQVPFFYLYRSHIFEDLEAETEDLGIRECRQEGSPDPFQQSALVREDMPCSKTLHLGESLKCALHIRGQLPGRAAAVSRPSGT